MKRTIWTVGLSCGLLLTSALGADDKTPPPVKEAIKSLATQPATKKTADAPAEPTAAEDKDADKRASVWMRKKLDYSQNILAGITSGDFELVRQNANAMKGLGKIETFVRGRTPGYKTQMQIFQEANDELLRQAQRESADGAALAFTQLTITCINCHKQLREHEGKTATPKP